MKLERITLTLDHGIYGRPTTPAYAAGGLAVHKSGRLWRVSHVASGSSVHGREDRRTKAEAVAQMERLIALPVDWRKTWDDIKPEFVKHAGAIRAAMES